MLSPYRSVSSPPTIAIGYVNGPVGAVRPTGVTADRDYGPETPVPSVRWGPGGSQGGYMGVHG